MSDIVERLKLHADRFLAKTTKVDSSDCIEWVGTKYKNGYGRFFFDGISLLAHRASMILKTGQEIPEGMHVCHTCDNRCCVNPDHLWLGTNQENTQDKMNKGRHWVPFGSSRSDSKLNEELVRYIRSSDKQHKQLGKELGVSESLIRGVRKNEYWKHV